MRTSDPQRPEAEQPREAPTSNSAEWPSWPQLGAPVSERDWGARRRQVSLAKSAGIVAGAFVVSRLLGLVREIVLARQFGTSEAFSAYVSAFRIPDLLFLVVMAGAFGSAFIPVFSGFLADGEDEAAWKLASVVLNVSGVSGDSDGGSRLGVRARTRALCCGARGQQRGAADHGRLHAHSSPLPGLPRIWHRGERHPRGPGPFHPARAGADRLQRGNHSGRDLAWPAHRRLRRRDRRGRRRNRLPLAPDSRAGALRHALFVLVRPPDSGCRRGGAPPCTSADRPGGVSAQLHRGYEPRLAHR